jgi:hypothetical protein
MLPDHYTKTLVGSVVDQRVYRKLVEIHMPRLSAHLDKLYLDLSTFSVPWFLCLYLNTVSLNVAVTILDSFFLEGPKFLFWISIAVLKVNEDILIQKGKDDDIFVTILKEFFVRLGSPDMDEQDVSLMAGNHLFKLLLGTACDILGPHITNETIESLRMQFRLDVVHKMEETNRKSQIRTICEQVSLSLEEMGLVYDLVRAHEFQKSNQEEDPTGLEAQQSRERLQVEEQLYNLMAQMGGWGFCTRYQHEPLMAGQKRIDLYEFEKIFKIVSPIGEQNTRMNT